jgi:hypothetical protein
MPTVSYRLLLSSDRHDNAYDERPAYHLLYKSPSDGSIAAADFCFADSVMFATRNKKTPHRSRSFYRFSSRYFPGERPTSRVNDLLKEAASS